MTDKERIESLQSELAETQEMLRKAELTLQDKQIRCDQAHETVETLAKLLSEMRQDSWRNDGPLDVAEIIEEAMKNRPGPKPFGGIRPCTTCGRINTLCACATSAETRAQDIDATHTRYKLYKSKSLRHSVMARHYVGLFETAKKMMQILDFWRFQEMPFGGMDALEYLAADIQRHHLKDFGIRLEWPDEFGWLRTAGPGTDTDLPPIDKPMVGLTHINDVPRPDPVHCDKCGQRGTMVLDECGKLWWKGCGCPPRAEEPS